MIGSFLNVLIYRIPRELDFVKERSNCPNCKKLVYWYENIPVISYLFLRGKCSGCGWKIPFKYPIVEILSGAMSLYLMPKSISMESLTLYLFYFSVFSCFLVHFIIDVEFQILPNVINIYLLAIFLFYAVTFLPLAFWTIGLAVGFLFPYLVSFSFKKLRGVEGLGMGDVKLFGVLGIILGPLGVIQNIFLSCMLGSLSFLILMPVFKLNKNSKIPFGPFILIVAAFQIFTPKHYNKFFQLLF